MWRSLALVALLGGCVGGVGFGGAWSSSPKPAPQPGGGQLRISGGLGWGWSLVHATAVVEARYVTGVSGEPGTDAADGDAIAGMVGGQVALVYPTYESSRLSRGFGLLGRALYGGANDLRVAEQGLGIGMFGMNHKHGPITLAIYYARARVTDAAGAGGSNGIELLFTAPISNVLCRYAKTFC